jgi:hypothetical protein
MPVHGKHARIVLDSVSYSGYLNSISLGLSRGTAEKTVYGDEAQRFNAALRTSTISAGGFFTEDLNDDMGSRMVSEVDTLSLVAPGGLGVGNFVAIAPLVPTSYTIDSPNAENVGISIESTTNGELWAGHSLHDLVSVVAGGNSTALDQVDETTGGALGQLHITDATGVTPELSVSIQHSPDDSVWTDLVTFTPATAAGSEQLTVSGTVDQYIRALWTVGGTSPNFTFTVAFTRL